MKISKLVTLYTFVAFLAACSSNTPKEQSSVVKTDADKSSVMASPVAEPVAVVESVAEPTHDSKLETAPITTANNNYAIKDGDSQSVVVEVYNCEHSSNKRVISVLNNSAPGLACEVTYEKSSGTKTLWTARNDKSYCTDKAAEFAIKQASWGWNCVDSNDVAVAVPAIDVPVNVPVVASAQPQSEHTEKAPVDSSVSEEEGTDSMQSVEGVGSPGNSTAGL